MAYLWHCTPPQLTPRPGACSSLLGSATRNSLLTVSGPAWLLTRGEGSSLASDWRITRLAVLYLPITTDITFQLSASSSNNKQRGARFQDHLKVLKCLK